MSWSNRVPQVTIALTGVRDPYSLQIALSRSLDFPDWYGRSWDAFWDAITGLVVMPEVLAFEGWRDLEGTLPEEAHSLSSLLDRMARQYPQLAPKVVYS